MIESVAGKRLLLRLPSWLGDFVMAEPLVRACHGAGAEQLSLAAPRALLELLDGRFPGARRLPLDGPIDGRGWRGHDLALLLDGSARSARAAWRAGIGERVGGAGSGRAAFLTAAVRAARERGGLALGLGRAGAWPRRLPRPFPAVCAELGAAIGVLVQDLAPQLEPSDTARESVARRMAGAGLDPDAALVLVHVGARPASAKGYGAEAWGQVVGRLAADAPGLTFALAAGPGEEADLARAAASARAGGVTGAESLLVLDDPVALLPELLAWTERARLVLCADGGARHLAAAVGVPRVVVFGPTDPRHTAYDGGHERHLREVVPCGPCHLERCPEVGAAERACMTRVEPHAVAAAAAQLLGS